MWNLSSLILKNHHPKSSRSRISVDMDTTKIDWNIWDVLRGWCSTSWVRGTSGWKAFVLRKKCSPTFKRQKSSGEFTWASGPPFGREEKSGRGWGRWGKVLGEVLLYGSWNERQGNVGSKFIIWRNIHAPPSFNVMFGITNHIWPFSGSTVACNSIRLLHKLGKVSRNDIANDYCLNVLDIDLQVDQI
jgi:hypothetical protein